MIDLNKIRATIISIAVLRVMQNIQEIQRHRSGGKIAKALGKMNSKFEKENRRQMDWCYSSELILAKATEKELGKMEIEPATLICNLLETDKEIMIKYFKLNWGHVEKIMNLRWANQESKFSSVKNALNYSKSIHEKMEELIENQKWRSWIRENQARFSANQKRIAEN